MYYTVLGIYIAAVFVFGIVILLILKMEANTGQQCMLGYMLCAVVQNVGYVFELTSHSPEAAMTAVRMQYLGSSYVMVFLCEFIYFFLRCQRPKHLFAVLGAGDTILLWMMWHNQFGNLFYRDYRWIDGSPHGYLKVSYGPVFYMWTFWCFVLPCVIIIAVSYRSSVLRKTLFERRQAVLLSLITGLPLLELLVYVFVLRTEYDLNPLTVGIVLAAITLFLFRSSTNDIRQLSVEKVTDRLNEVIIIADDLGYVIDCNAKAEEVLGDIRGHHLGAQYESVRRLDPAELNKSFDIRGRVYENLVEGIYARDGRVIGYLIMLFDTTRLHGAMEELTVLKEKAEEANEAKSHFLSSMSHEIRTPMNTIVGITEIMLARTRDRETREYLMNIRTSGESLLSIINDILDFSKIENGSIQMQEAEYDLMSMFQDLGMMFLNRIGEKPIELLFDIDGNLPARVVGDSTRMRQVIINIVNNAIKYTEGGYVRLAVGCRTRDDGRYDLDFSVTDTGIGIRQEDFERLFDTFTRLDAERNCTKEGSGLGLSIARRLIEQMEGHIDVESIYGMGSKFTFHVVQGAAQTREPAVNLDAYRGCRVSAVFRNSSLTSTLIHLVKTYGMDYLMHPEAGEHIDYFFTDIDTYPSITGQLQEMRDCGARIIVLQNPMRHNPVLEETVLNKPLYTLTFAGAINGAAREYDLQERSDRQAFTAPGAHILIVDDNEMNLKVAKGLIEPLQAVISTAGNGEEALARIRSGRPDLVLMDHMMPVMDGVEATRALRSMDEDYFRTVPVIALTANAIVGMEKEFLSAGMNGMIAKPVDIKILYRTIRDFLPPELVAESDDEAGKTQRVSEESVPPQIEGIDVEKGILYCQGLEALFQFFGDFCSDIEEKTKLIEELVSTEDFKNYTVEVHGLKGASRLIGAMELADAFYELERLGKEENLDGMKRRTAEVLREYHAVGQRLKPYCKKRR